MPSRKGSPNKNKQFLLNKLQEMYGKDFDPIIKAAESAIKLSKLADEAYDCRADDAPQQLKASVDSWDKIAQYVTPKLKAVEIDGNIDHDGVIQIKWQK